ncbi:JAB domain-containing protein [Candidatus Cardinium hertigii]|uniref:JAB domain-containing protein n=1 Tax=Candidatus Cardinium hertigii TaxID=247481 RepID=UPI003D7C776F
MLIYLRNQDKIAIHDAVDAYNVMLMILEREDKPDLSKEHLWVIALSIRNLIVNIELVSVGSSYFTSVDPKEIMCFPSQKKAAGIIMIHNHPVGEMSPSLHDLDATDRMIQVGRILDIQVIDHLIISERKYFGYYSFEDHRIMDKLRRSIKYIPSFELKENFEKRLDHLEKTFKEEIKLTKEISRQKGKLEGILVGKEKGKIERNREIAKSMLEEGYSIEKIIRVTGLSNSDIQKIK